MLGRLELRATAWLVLAHALNTSPAALIYPGPYDQETEVLPGRTVTEHSAVQWFSALAYWPIEPITDDLPNLHRRRATPETCGCATPESYGWRATSKESRLPAMR
jgi:hypothetical protein